MSTLPSLSAKQVAWLLDANSISTVAHTFLSKQETKSQGYLNLQIPSCNKESLNVSNETSKGQIKHTGYA